MAANEDFPLTAEPQQVAHNSGSRPVAYVLTNLSAAANCELLGKGEALGAGTPILPGAQVSLDVGVNEELFAAADTADNVTLRVFSYDGGGNA